MRRPASRHQLRRAEGLVTLSARELADRIRRREVSVREVVTAFLERIDEVNPTVNAIVSLRARDDILAEADARDAELTSGIEPAPLFGLPLAVKDLAETKGMRTTWGSPVFADFVPTHDAIFVERLREAGAIIIGKTNTPEFGFGSHTFNEVFSATRNAFDPALTAGGSSGGAAVALALDMVPVADGSDFGGSLRNPAAYNNVFGMRPSQGLVPTGPDAEFFYSQLGIEGPMARNIRDLALLLDVQAGYDARAPLSLHGQPNFLAGLEAPAKPGRIAWLGDLGGHLAMEAGVLDLCRTGVERFEAAGWSVEAFVPDFDYEALWAAFVDIRHATSGLGLKALYDDPQKRALLKPEAVWEIEGSFDLTAADFRRAAQMRSAWYNAVLEMFERFDLLAIPSAQVFPFDINMRWPSEIAGRKMDTYHRWQEVSAYATFSGCPALNVPVGFDASGRPMGVQLIGRPREDLAVLQAGALYETLMDWRTGA